MPQVSHLERCAHEVYSDPVSKVFEALQAQALACRRLGSMQYAVLLEQMAASHRRGGPIARLLEDRSARPMHDAIPLRLLAFLHLAALTGQAPELALRFPSCGGDGQPIPLEAVHQTLKRLSWAVDAALSRPVQTNEVGRSVCLLAIATWLPTLNIDDFDLWEIGTSAGLNLSFDRYAANTEHGVLGSPGSSVTLPSTVFLRPPLIDTSATCVDRRGCDPDPIDLDTHVPLLESYVWPDQLERRARLLSAIEITRSLGHHITAASADEWVLEQFTTPPDRPIVIFHSIVWQYMSPEIRERFRGAIFDAGESGRSVIWARMEPAGPRSDLRADVWLSGTRTRYHLADVGYHGQDFDWLERILSD